MCRRAVMVLAAVLTAGGSRGPAAADPEWMREFVCDIASEGRDAPTRISPLRDSEQQELRELGHSKRMVGNKPHTRHETHAWVAFTFDDGPNYKTTPQILDALEKYDVPATFFVAGWRLEGKYRKLVERNVGVLRDLVRRGFHVGNHTQRHKDLRRLREPAYKKEIERTAQAIENVTGVRPYLVRFPYGGGNDRVREFLDQERYTEVFWNIDSDDYLVKNPKFLRKKVLRQIVSKNGGVVLFHDTKRNTARALPGLLDDLEALNCQRLKREEPLLVPVSLHYFAREKNGKPRPVPRAVAARTARYRANLPARCRARIDKSKSNN